MAKEVEMQCHETISIDDLFKLLSKKDNKVKPKQDIVNNPKEGKD